MIFLRDDLTEIAKILRDGGVICAPTDTIWGLSCDATNPAAVERISEIKQRPPEKGYVVLVSDLEMLKNHVSFVPPRLETLLDYHLRPLTIIYDEGENLPKSVLGPNGSVAIRIVRDDFCKELIEKLGRPIVSTSANVSNEPFPKNFGGIASNVLQACDYVVRHRQGDSAIGEPSTIGRLDAFQELEFLRE